jgi:SET domain-containing protein
MRRRFIPGPFKLDIKRSRTGRGMFAGERIPRGACVIEYTGRPATDKQVRKNAGKYLFWTSSKTMIDGYIPANRARFINHSCAPNCEIDIKNKRIYIFAKRAIKAGEEITYDYDTEYFDAHIKPRGCLCNNCIKKRAQR